MPHGLHGYIHDMPDQSDCPTLRLEFVSNLSELQEFLLTTHDSESGFSVGDYRSIRVDTRLKWNANEDDFLSFINLASLYRLEVRWCQLNGGGAELMQ